MGFGSRLRAYRKSGSSLSVLVTLALAGCSGGFDGTSPFMEVYLEMEEAEACRHVWYPTPPRRVYFAQVEKCENTWMRNRIESALLKRFPLGSDVRKLVRNLESEDFTCIKFDMRSSEYNTDNYKCYFDSIEQNYGPIFVLYLPRYPYEMKWIISVYYYDKNVLWLESWNELRGQRG